MIGPRDAPPPRRPVLPIVSRFRSAAVEAGRGFGRACGAPIPSSRSARLSWGCRRRAAAASDHFHLHVPSVSSRPGCGAGRGRPQPHGPSASARQPAPRPTGAPHLRARSCAGPWGPMPGLVSLGELGCSSQTLRL